LGVRSAGLGENENTQRLDGQRRTFNELLTITNVLNQSPLFTLTATCAVYLLFIIISISVGIFM